MSACCHSVTLNSKTEQTNELEEQSIMNLKSKKYTALGSALLTVTALIWGLAFVFQRQLSVAFNAYAFNGSRFFLATIFLFALVIGIDLWKRKQGQDRTKFSKTTILGGMLLGLILFFGNNLQQMGIETTTAGKAGFITSLYIVIVPVLSLLRRKKTGMLGWIAILIAIAGFWTISITDDFTVGLGDILILLCAFIFAFHISFMDIFVKEVDAVKLTAIQFLTATVISIPFVAVYGMPSIGVLADNILPLLYIGVMSSGAGFTLQALGQRWTPPSTATLLMSLESIFALFAGIIILAENPSAQELFGCILIFISVFVAEQSRPKKFLTLKTSKFYTD